MGFGTTVEDRLRGRLGSFLAFECGFESFFDEPFAKVGDGIAMTMKLLGNFLIGHATVRGLIDGKKNVGVFDLRGTALAGRNELSEFGPFFGSQSYFVNLLHRDFMVCLNVKNEEYKIRKSKAREKYIKLELKGH